MYQVKKSTRRVFITKGDVIDISDFRGFFIVKDGVVKVSVLGEDGKELSLDILSDNDVFPCGFASYEDSSNFWSAETLFSSGREIITSLHNSNLIFLDGDTLDFDDGLYSALFEKLMHKTERIKEILYSMVFYPLEKRVISVIYYLARRLSEIKKYDIGMSAHIFRDLNSGAGRVELEITHEELASFCGATRECITNTLKNLENSGLVKTGRKKIVMYLTEKSFLRE